MKKFRKFILRVFFPRRYEEEFVYPVMRDIIYEFIDKGILTTLNPYGFKNATNLYVEKLVKEQMQKNETI